MEINDLLSFYKTELEKKLSEISVRNYLTDVKHFFTWCANKNLSSNYTELLTKNVIDNYISFYSNEYGDLSYTSLKRHISSLKSFSSFLLEKNIIAENPFSVTEQKKEDNWHIHEYKNYLYENKSSRLTIKYYINDLDNFRKWYEEVTLDNSNHNVPNITDKIINEYSFRLQNVLLQSPSSINRKLSSIRRYCSFLKVKMQVQSVRNFPNTLTDTVSIEELTPSSKPKTYSKLAPIRIVQKLSEPYVAFEEKLSSKISGLILSKRLDKILRQSENGKLAIDEIVKGTKFKNIKKEFYAPHSISLSNFPTHKKILHHIRYTRPKWYKRYHTYSFVHYAHFGVLVIFAVICSVFLYNNTLGKATAQSSHNLISLSRTFTFSARLTDKNNNAITSSSDIKFALYDSPTNKKSILWQEVQKSIKPDKNGYISLTIGSVEKIPDNLFIENTPLYLGVTVGDDEELLPRKQIGVPFANNTDTLQGLSPITNSNKQSNVVLALNSSGNLSIGGEADHTFEAAGSNFTLSGKTLILTTSIEGGGNLVLNPSGNGKIELNKTLTSNKGIIYAENPVSISATSSANPAISLSQDSSGDLLTASTAGSTKFTINNQGVITKGTWSADVIGTEFGGFGANISATSAGEIIYSTGIRSYGHLAAGSAGQCLVSNGRAAPLWSNCQTLSFLNGAAFFGNTLLDFLIGGNSTSSAKFAFTNVSNGTPKFKINGSLILSSDTIETDNKDLKIGGNNTKNIIINTSSNIGVKNTNPQRTFDVTGNWGGNVDYYLDGANTQTVTRDTKALIYDLEKNTGTDNSSTTTTYNIVGLPEIDGTVAYIYAKVIKDTTSAAQTQSIVIKINDNIISTVSTNDGIPSVGPESKIEHFTVTRSNSSWHLVGKPGDSDNADLAEWTEYNGITPKEGEIVSIGENGKIEISNSSYDKRLAGIISTKPNITLGLRGNNTVRLALSGRVPTIVTNINGTILAGDSITSSPLSGIGMKPNRSASIVGKALQSFEPDNLSCKTVDNINEIIWPYDDGKNISRPCFRVRVMSLETSLRQTLLSKYGLTNSDYIYVGKIMVLASLSWSDSSDLITSLENASIENEEENINLDNQLAALINTVENSSTTIKIGGNAIDNIGAFSKIIAGKIKTGILVATNISTDNFTASKAIINELAVNTISVTGNLVVEGKSLKDYISDEFKNQKELVSPIAVVDSLKTNEISSKNGDSISINIPSYSRVSIKNKDTKKEVIKLNGNGTIEANTASVSGVIAENINTNNASVSGTLTTDKLVAKEISGLDEKIESITKNAVKNSSINNLSLNLSPYISDASVSAKFGTFYEGLLSLGASTFGNLSVMDSLNIGTSLTFGNNSVNTLGVDLEIQPLKQGGINFMAGALKINIDGTLSVSENALFNKNLTVKGKFEANLISPLSDDLTVNLPKDNSKLTVKNASSSAVLAVSQSGDVIASGSGNFSKLKLQLVGQAIASSDNEAVATGSAGTAILKKNTKELTIINKNVSQDSLIYITPANNTSNQVIYLQRQVAENLENGTNGSFTVGVSNYADKDILFNWLIVN